MRVGAPRWLYTTAYIALRCTAVFYLPDFLVRGRAAVLTLVVVWGVLYTLGGIVYGIKRPTPLPKTFGFHEVDDVKRGIDLLGATRVVLIGESRGAAVALQTAARDSRVVGVVAGASFSDLSTIAAEHRIHGLLAAAMQRLDDQVVVANRPCVDALLDLYGSTDDPAVRRVCTDALRRISRVSLVRADEFRSDLQAVAAAAASASIHSEVGVVAELAEPVS